METIEELKKQYEILTNKYNEMKRIYDGVGNIMFKSKDIKNKHKKLGREMYTVNLQQITLLQKISGINI